MELLAELAVPACGARSGLEVAARAAAPLAELGARACCVWGGPEVAARPVEPHAELEVLA